MGKEALAMKRCRLQITTRQQEHIRRQAVAGKSDCQISREMGIPRTTVRWHRLYGKVAEICGRKMSVNVGAATVSIATVTLIN